MDIPEELVSESSLTSRQTRLLISYMKMLHGEIKLPEAASIGAEGRVKGLRGKALTPGSYYRTVEQGKDNIRQAFVTVLLSVWLGVAKLEDVRKLLDLAGGKMSGLSDEEWQRLIQVLDALLDRMIL